MIVFKHILARILKNNVDLFSRLFFKIILPKSWKIILKVSDRRTGGVRGGDLFTLGGGLSLSFKIILQYFGKIILKNNLENKSKKCPPENIFRLGRSFLQNRLKRVSPKFHANRSHPRGGNGLSKFWIFFKIILGCADGRFA